MKPHELVAAWKRHGRYPAICQTASSLQKQGLANDAIIAAIAAEFGPEPKRRVLKTLNTDHAPMHIFGDVGVGADIEPPAVEQLITALRLPIAISGALMPDAHPGYALPIGGVLNANHAVAPAFVGVDIGCRMHLTIFEQTTWSQEHIFRWLKQATVFGVGQTSAVKADHAILDDPRWQAAAFVRGLRDKAAAQLGTSGAGNHFAEVMRGVRMAPMTGVPYEFEALLTHSGSRGVGYKIATHYMEVAKRETARHASVPAMYEWLDLDTEAGQEYWQAMELAADFAKANHEVIHARFAALSGWTPSVVIQNTHNLAWRDGDVVTHRKGATPAETGVLGVIPGSMGTSSYVVEGLGNADSLNSASHGAGRRGSRTWARDTINRTDVERDLRAKGILVHGLTTDEAPQAYKDIERVMRIQQVAGLIQPVARMQPIAVIMGGEKGED